MYPPNYLVGMAASLSALQQKPTDRKWRRGDQPTMLKKGYSSHNVYIKHTLSEEILQSVKGLSGLRFYEFDFVSGGCVPVVTFHTDRLCN